MKPPNNFSQSIRGNKILEQPLCACFYGVFKSRSILPSNVAAEISAGFSNSVRKSAQQSELSKYLLNRGNSFKISRF